jgi:uncharacterized protein (TIRG00374 family)
MVGGDYIRVINTASFGRYVQAFSAVLAERVTGLLVMLALALTAALANLQRDLAVGLEWLIWSTVFASIVGLAVGAITLVSRNTSTGRIYIFRWTKPVNEVWLAMIAIMKNKTAFLKVIILSIFFHVLLISNGYMFGRSVGLDLDILTLAVIFPAAMLVAMLPISLNGIGVMETSLIILLGQVGVEPEQGFVIALLSRIFIVIASIIGAGLYALTKDIAITPVPRREMNDA